MTGTHYCVILNFPTKNKFTYYFQYFRRELQSNRRILKGVCVYFKSRICKTFIVKSNHLFFGLTLLKRITDAFKCLALRQRITNWYFSVLQVTVILLRYSSASKKLGKPQTKTCKNIFQFISIVFGWGKLLVLTLVAFRSRVTLINKATSDLNFSVAKIISILFSTWQFRVFDLRQETCLTEVKKCYKNLSRGNSWWTSFCFFVLISFLLSAEHFSLLPYYFMKREDVEVWKNAGLGGGSSDTASAFLKMVSADECFLY